MNLNRQQAVDLASQVVHGAVAHADTFARRSISLVLCPPALYLEAVLNQTKGSDVAVGAQNAYFQPAGAFTGEISSEMIADLGCTYVIIGHSERRQVFGESDQMINQKLAAVIAAGLQPIFCVGETLAEREAGETAQVIEHQFREGTKALNAEDFSKIVIAYEPVWAIGTGKVATPNQAETVHSDLRKLIGSCYNSSLENSVSILYGGSVNSANAAELLAQPNIDGALVGGASLKADSFMAIAASA